MEGHAFTRAINSRAERRYRSAEGSPLETLLTTSNLATKLNPMAIPQRTASEGTFFITTICYNRRRIFQIPRNAELFLEILTHYRANFLLHAYVLMPDHAHLILTPCDKTLSQVMNLIKGGFSRRLASKLPVWQRGFTDHRIRDAADYAIRLNYIHRNPVDEHLCDKPEDYPFSSANPKLYLDEYHSVARNSLPSL